MMKSNVTWDLTPNFLTQPDRFDLKPICDDLMSPTFSKGDVVVIDKSKKLDSTGVFRINNCIVRLERLVSGGVLSIYDNEPADRHVFDREPETTGQVVMIFRPVC